jgi:hypothetical protein
MTAQRKLSKVAEAYQRCYIAREALRQSGARCMEVTEDKCGIVWERYIVGPNGTSVILYATPHWWDVFSPITSDTTNDGTIAAIKALAQ